MLSFLLRTPTLAAAAVGILVSLPYWLPHQVTALRNWLFTRINGDQSLSMPSASISPAEAMEIYKHPSASGRAEGARLSDLFWYWMAPGAHLHQENMEAGALYEATRRTTRKILALRPAELRSLLDRHFGDIAVSDPAHNSGDRSVTTELDQEAATDPLLGTRTGRSWQTLKLTAWFMPRCVGLYFDMVFGRLPTPAERAVLGLHADDFLAALKGNRRRDMGLRLQATALLVDALAELPAGRLAPLSEVLTLTEQAEYIQINFFSTGVTQLSEALAHCLFALADHPAEQSELLANDFRADHLAAVVKEVFRLYPLFGISHRILHGAITTSTGRVLPAGTVVCLDHEAYNQMSYSDPKRFLTSRWYDKSLARDAIPFGVKENRSCPAEGFVTNVLSDLIPRYVRAFHFHTTAQHTRSMANFAPCLVARRGYRVPQLGLHLARLYTVDTWSRLGLALRQLVYGVAMVREAERLRPCAKYFAQGGARTVTTELPVVAAAPQDRLSVR